MTKKSYTEFELWRHGEGEITVYHVFSTICMDRTVLAFAEARYGDGSDGLCPHDLVMRRSEDGGVSFAETEVVRAAEGRFCWTNPCPVFDAETERLFLFYEENIENKRTKTYLIFSDDRGALWSEPRELTDLIGDGFTLAGPGHGVCLRGGERRGRLLMPLWHRGEDVTLPKTERGYCVSLLVSDDRGETWTCQHKRFGEVLANESRMTETWEGLVWHLRTKSEVSRMTYSRDGGENWSEAVPSPISPAKSCDAGLISLNDTVILSRVSHGTERRDMELCISDDGGKSFSGSIKMPEGNAIPGYSDLCILEDRPLIVGLVHCREKRVLFSRICINE